MINDALTCGSSDKRNSEYLEAFSTQAFFRALVLEEEPVIVDVGAHRGESVRIFKEIFPKSRIYSFEPDPVNFQVLKKYCSEVSKSAGDIIPINKAVGDQSGSVKFFRQNISHLGGLSPVNRFSKDSLGYAETALNEPILVQSITLDNFFFEHGLKSIDLLKIDVQGFEIPVLRGGREALQKTNCCTVEVALYDFYEKSSSILLVEQAMHDAELVLWDISKVSKNPKNFRTDWVELVYRRP